MSALVNKNKMLIPCMLGLVSAFFIYNYAQGLKNEIKSSQEEIAVVIAVKNIEPDTIISPTSVHIQMVPKEYVVDKYISQMNKVVGKTTKVAIYKNEQVNSERISDPSSNDSTYMDIPSGFRALTISPDDTTNATGFVKKGDSVDLILARDQYGDDTQGPIVVERVKVLQSSYGHSIDTDKEDGPTTLTLLLEPNIAKQVAYADEFGRIRIVLRPDDPQLVETTGTSKGITIASITSEEKKVPKPKLVSVTKINKSIPKPNNQVKVLANTQPRIPKPINQEANNETDPVEIIRGTETSSVFFSN